jgi:hypothetical protein
MSPVWVNQKILDTSQPKAKAWSPAAPKEKTLWGICQCGEPICEGDSVGMYGEHERVVCYTCWLTGEHPEMHLDCAGLRFPDVTLTQ